MDRFRKRMTRTLTFGKGSKTEKEEAVQGTSYTSVSPGSSLAPQNNGEQSIVEGQWTVEEDDKPTGSGAAPSSIGVPESFDEAPPPPLPRAVVRGSNELQPITLKNSPRHDNALVEAPPPPLPRSGRRSNELVASGNNSRDDRSRMEAPPPPLPHGSKKSSELLSSHSRDVRAEAPPPPLPRAAGQAPKEPELSEWRDDSGDDVTSGSANDFDDEWDDEGEDSEESLSELLDQVVNLADHQLHDSETELIDWESVEEGSENEQQEEQEDHDAGAPEVQLNDSGDDGMELTDDVTQVQATPEYFNEDQPPIVDLAPPSNEAQHQLPDYNMPPESIPGPAPIPAPRRLIRTPSGGAILDSDDGIDEDESQSKREATSMIDENEVDSFRPSALKMTLRMFSVPFDKSFSRQAIVDQVKTIVGLYATVLPADEVLAISRPINELDDLLLRMSLKKNIHKCKTRWELLHLAIKLVRPNGIDGGIRSNRDSDEATTRTVEFIQDIEEEGDIESLPVATLKHILFTHHRNFDEATPNERLIKKVKKEWRYYNVVKSASELSPGELELMDEKQLRESLLMSVDKCRTKEELIAHVRRFRAE